MSSDSGIEALEREKDLLKLLLKSTVFQRAWERKYHGLMFLKGGIYSLKYQGVHC